MTARFHDIAYVLLVAALMVVFGCATLNPGADPLIVRAEQAESSAIAAFDLVLAIDHSNRGFWMTNAPAFHRFAEWLREPQTIGTNELRRGTALVWSLQTVKADYRSTKQGSNLVVTAMATLQSAVSQANAWLTIATNQPEGAP